MNPTVYQLATAAALRADGDHATADAILALSPDEVADILLGTVTPPPTTFAEWRPYRGPEGGMGWQSDTGEVRYQREKPDDNDGTGGGTDPTRQDVGPGFGKASRVLGGALAGGLTGSALGGPLGMAVGTVAGAAIGSDTGQSILGGIRSLLNRGEEPEGIARKVAGGDPEAVAAVRADATAQARAAAANLAAEPPGDPAEVRAGWAQASAKMRAGDAAELGGHVEALATAREPDKVESAFRAMGGFLGKLAAAPLRLAMGAIKAFGRWAAGSGKKYLIWAATLATTAAAVVAPPVAVVTGLISTGTGFLLAPAAAAAPLVLPLIARRLVEREGRLNPAASTFAEHPGQGDPGGPPPNPSAPGEPGPLDKDGLPVEGDAPDLSPEDERVLRELFGVAGFAEFAEWTGPHTGERGGTYWLPAGQPDDPSHRAYQDEKPSEGDQPDKDKPLPAGSNTPAPAGERVVYGRSWDEPDWVPLPSKGKPKWRNLDTGAERYGPRPKDRAPEQKRTAWDRVQARLAAPAADRPDGGGLRPAHAAAVTGAGGAAGLLGVPAGAVVGAYANGQGPGAAVSVTIDHPFAEQWSRAVTPRPDGTVHVHNSMFFLKPRYQGGGFGTKAFTSQVRACFAGGADSISTLAGKGRLGRGGAQMNGYYTWAALGYDADLTPEYRRRLPADMKGAKTVQDLMSTQAGAAHWKQTGYMTEMTFDLSPGSKSLARLNAYLAKKGEPPIDTGPEAVGARTAAIAARKARLDAATAAEQAARPAPQPAPSSRPPLPSLPPAASLQGAIDAAMSWADARRGDALRRQGMEAQVRRRVDALLPDIRVQLAGIADPAERQRRAAQLVDNVWREQQYAYGRQRFAAAFESPTERLLHESFANLARQKGLDPAVIKEVAGRSGVNFAPDGNTAIRNAYYVAFELAGSPVDGATRDQFAERFAEGPADYTPAGPDGKRAVELLATSQAAGVNTLTEVCDRAVRRLLMLPHPEHAAHLFEDDELHRIAGSLAGGIATADLLGRSRVRRRAEMAERVQAFAEKDDPGPPGAPPRPGLKWKRETQRWVRRGREHAAELTRRAKEAPAKLKNKVRSYVEKKYAKLAERYGENGAKAVMAASLLLLPVPVPGASFVPIALAEAVRAVGKGAKAVGFAEGEAASEDWVEAVIEFLTELYAEAGEELPAIDPERVRAALERDEVDDDQPAETFAEQFADDPWHDFAEPVPAVEPAAAVDYFRRLVPTLADDPGRYGLALGRHAFTLAVATEQTILQKVKDAILAGLRTGTDATADVQDVLDAAGVSPRNPQYAEMVTRTATMDALNSGAVAEMQTPEMQEAFPVWRYDGILDSRTGDDHRPLIGRHYPSTANFADVRGPRVWNCRCSPTPVFRSEAADLIRAGKVERG